jgi:hypothetical protein
MQDPKETKRLIKIEVFRNGLFVWPRGRGMTALGKDKELQKYFGYIGFTEGSAFHGSRFQTALGTRLYKYVLPSLQKSQKFIDEHWWVGFEGADFDRVYEKLQDLVTYFDLQEK